MAGKVPAAPGCGVEESKKIGKPEVDANQREKTTSITGAKTGAVSSVKTGAVPAVKTGGAAKIAGNDMVDDVDVIDIIVDAQLPLTSILGIQGN